MDKTEIHEIQSRIDAYREGRLSREEIDRLWVDLIEYPDLLEYLVNSVNMKAIAAEELRKHGQSSVLKLVGSQDNTVIFQLTRKWSRFAAVLLVGVGLLSTAYFWGNDNESDLKAIADIELDSFRSSAIPALVFDHEVQGAINLAAMEQYEEAIEKLEELESSNLTREQLISLQVNKGSVYYNKGDYSSAGLVFNEILDQYDELHVLTEEQVHWFLGNTYLQLGNNELAMVHFQKTYDLNGAYRRLAERYLR